MDSVPATLRIGIHIRIGDSAVSNAVKKGDQRYRPGCDGRRNSALSGRSPCAHSDQRLRLDATRHQLRQLNRFRIVTGSVVGPLLLSDGSPGGPCSALSGAGRCTCDRAGICWVRQAIRECDAVHPRRCVVWLASDHSQALALRAAREDTYVQHFIRQHNL